MIGKQMASFSFFYNRQNLKLILKEVSNLQGNKRYA